MNTRIAGVYLGAPIRINEPGCEPVSAYIEGVDHQIGKIISERVDYDPSWIRLQLKNINSITIEESIEIGRMMNVIDEDCPEKDLEYWGKYTIETYLNFSKRKTLNFGIIEVVDFLRARGYDMGYGTIQSLIDEGIADELGLSFDDTNTFNPNWRTPPGGTIKDILDERNISLEEFSYMMDIIDIDKLISGEMFITPKIAKQLSETLGSSVNFWINRERNYRKPL